VVCTTRSRKGQADRQKNESGVNGIAGGELSVRVSQCRRGSGGKGPVEAANGVEPRAESSEMIKALFALAI
jgi:hypothetical protein